MRHFSGMVFKQRANAEKRGRRKYLQPRFWTGNPYPIAAVLLLRLFLGGLIGTVVLVVVMVMMLRAAIFVVVMLHAMMMLALGVTGFVMVVGALHIAVLHWRFLRGRVSNLLDVVPAVHIALRRRFMGLPFKVQ
jgi:hypothetical protein